MNANAAAFPCDPRGGPIGKLRDGDIVRLDGEAGTLEALVDAAEWAARETAPNTAPAGFGLGRSLFANNRALVTPADHGALSISCGPLRPDGSLWNHDADPADPADAACPASASEDA